VARLNDRLAALTAMSSAQLRDEWPRVAGGIAPSVPPDLLRRMLGQQLQEKRYGALPATVVRELTRASSDDNATPPKPAIDIRPGTRFVREWHGRTISVLAVDDGFLWDERHFPSLTAIAREATGAGWSGPRFFGLTSRAR